jgi:hypothetical protein
MEYETRGKEIPQLLEALGLLSSTVEISGLPEYQLPD